MTFASLAEKTIALITPNIATSSQKMILAHPIRMGGFFEEGARGGVLEMGEYDIRFLVRIRGAFTPPPRMDVPVIKIPLEFNKQLRRGVRTIPCCSDDRETYVKSYAEKTP